MHGPFPFSIFYFIISEVYYGKQIFCRTVPASKRRRN